MFVVNCSKQMGQRKKMIFYHNIVVFTRGVARDRMSDADRNCPAGVSG